MAAATMDAMSRKREKVLPYGSWPSPITAADVAKGAIRLGFPALVDGASAETPPDVWWLEGRPAEGGRQVIVSADTRRPAARSVERAHPGARVRRPLSWLAAARRLAVHRVVDQRIYRIAGSDRTRAR